MCEFDLVIELDRVKVNIYFNGYILFRLLLHCTHCTLFNWTENDFLLLFLRFGDIIICKIFNLFFLF